MLCNKCNKNIVPDTSESSNPVCQECLDEIKEKLDNWANNFEWYEEAFLSENGPKFDKPSSEQLIKALQKGSDLIKEYLSCCDYYTYEIRKKKGC